MLGFGSALLPCGQCIHPPDPSVIALDVDTVLTTQDVLDREAAETCQQLSEYGLLVIAVTGRPMAAARYWAKEIRASYVVALNGALPAKTELAGHILRSAKSVPEELLAKLSALAKQHEVNIGVHTLFTYHPSRTGADVETHAYRHQLDVRRGPWLPKQAIQAEIMGSSKQLRAMEEAVRSAAKIYGCPVDYSVDYVSAYLNVGPPNVTKAWGVDQVLRHTHELWRNVVSLAKRENASEMLRRSGTAIAVVGADPDLERVATHRVIGGSDTSSVRLALAALIEDNAEAARYLTCLHRGSGTA
jgi:hydroxymethylpyrimidine pyrophosphatase-like HAD family hydrolase